MARLQETEGPKLTISFWPLRLSCKVIPVSAPLLRGPAYEASELAEISALSRRRAWLRI